MCQDYIYDKDMEQIAKEEQRKAWKMQGMAAANTNPLRMFHKTRVKSQVSEERVEAQVSEATYHLVHVPATLLRTAPFHI